MRIYRLIVYKKLSLSLIFIFNWERHINPENLT